MNIIGLNQKESGCGYHRITLPLGFMNGIKGYVTNLITEDKLDGWDILIYNRLSQYDEQLQATKDLMKCKIVVDMDDYWKLPPSHLNYAGYEKFGSRIENNLREADLVTCTNEILASKIRPLNSNVYIAPNGIPFGRNQFTEERKESDRVRIFWSGGVTHEHDLKLLKYPFQKLLGLSNKIQMVIGGYNDNDPYSKEIWDRMFHLFTCGGKLPYKKIHNTSVLNYMQVYENADIMVIPLIQSDWHSCKSNLKLLEAASKKIPCIVSNVAPYNLDKDAPVLWVNKQTDWFKHLNYLINNGKEAEKLGCQLYEWAKGKYNLEDVNIGRSQAFRDLCEA